MQLFLNFLTEPGAGIGVQKEWITVGDKKILTYKLFFELKHGPITIILPDDFAKVLKDKLNEAVSNIVTAPTMN